jgi:cellobiose-specific phosphotransferase system component IIB
MVYILFIKPQIQYIYIYIEQELDDQNTKCSIISQFTLTFLMMNTCNLIFEKDLLVWETITQFATLSPLPNSLLFSKQT